MGAGPYRLVEVGANTAKVCPVDKPESEPILVSLDRLRRCPDEVGDEFWPPNTKRHPRKEAAVTVSGDDDKTDGSDCRPVFELSAGRSRDGGVIDDGLPDPCPGASLEVGAATQTAANENDGLGVDVPQGVDEEATGEDGDQDGGEVVRTPSLIVLTAGDVLTSQTTRTHHEVTEAIHTAKDMETGGAGETGGVTELPKKQDCKKTKSLEKAPFPASGLVVSGVWHEGRRGRLPSSRGKCNP